MNWAMEWFSDGTLLCRFGFFKLNKSFIRTLIQCCFGGKASEIGPYQYLKLLVNLQLNTAIRICQQSMQ